jgi:hypothetical protein
LTLPSAKDIAQKALFDNSNTLYKLNLTLKALPICTTFPDRSDRLANTTDTFSAKAIGDLLKSKNIDFVRLQWVDYCNMIVRPHTPLSPSLVAIYFGKI